jgi:hypothetical protein
MSVLGVFHSTCQFRKGLSLLTPVIPLYVVSNFIILHQNPPFVAISVTVPLE